MSERTKRRVERLEQQTTTETARIVVTYPGEPWPENLPPGCCHFVVEYVKPEPEVAA